MLCKFEIMRYEHEGNLFLFVELSEERHYLRLFMEVSRRLIQGRTFSLPCLLNDDVT
jgi:hypothetical protein